MAAVLLLAVRASILSTMDMMREVQSEGANFITCLYQLGYSYWTVMVALLTDAAGENVIVNFHREC